MAEAITLPSMSCYGLEQLLVVYPHETTTKYKTSFENYCTVLNLGIYAWNPVLITTNVRTKKSKTVDPMLRLD